MKLTELNVGQRLLVRDHIGSADYAKELIIREFSPSKDYARVEYQSGNEDWIPVHKYVVVELLSPLPVTIAENSAAFNLGYHDGMVHCRMPAEQRTCTGINPYVTWIEREKADDWHKGWQRALNDFVSEEQSAEEVAS